MKVVKVVLDAFLDSIVKNGENELKMRGLLK